MFRFLISICLVATLSVTADAKLNLKIDLPGGEPGQGGEEIFNKDFTPDNAVSSLNRIEKALESFRQLTEASRSTVPQDKMNKIGNTEGDIQSLGFGNWANTVKGTILKQEYLIKKLNYDLVQQRYNWGEAKQEEVQKAKKEFIEAEKKFQKFWDTFTIYD